MRNRWLIGPVLAAAAVVLAACGSNGSDPGTFGQGAAATTHSHSDPLTVRKMTTSKGVVLVDAQGRTLYWFAKDTPTKSRCNGSCASYWPPVIGKLKAAPGTSLPHKFGTIRRKDGKIQATYDGHPLYTYKGDTAAGQVRGNDINVSGGLWWAMTPSGKDLRAKSKSSGSGGSASGSSGSGSSGSGSSGSGGGW